MIEADARVSRAVPRGHVPWDEPDLVPALCAQWQRLRDAADDDSVPYEQCCVASDLSYDVEQRLLSTPVTTLEGASAFLAALSRNVGESADGYVPFRFDPDLSIAQLMRIISLLRQPI